MAPTPKSVQGSAGSGALGKTWQWVIIGEISALTLLLGYVGFWKYSLARQEARSVLDLLYLTVQLFIMESGAVQPPVPWELEIARFLAPIVSAWAVLKALALVFREQLQLIRLRFTSDHVVICGLSRKGLQLVKDFRTQGERVVVVEIDDQNDNLRMCHELGAIVLIGDATDKFILRKARAFCARYVVGTCKEDGTNLEIALLTYQLVSERKTYQHKMVRCFAHVVDLKLCELFKHYRIFCESGDQFEGRVFNIYENAARLLLADHPLDYDHITPRDPRAVHLVVAGFGQMGQSIVLQTAKIGHYANGKKVRITVIDKAAGKKRRSFYSRYPMFEQVCDATFLTEDVEEPEIHEKIRGWAEEEGSLTTLVICLDDDWRSLFCALSMVTKMKGHKIPLHVRMAQDTTLVALRESEAAGSDRISQVHPYGIINEVCTRKMLLDEELDLIGRAIHRDFAKRRIEEGRPRTDPSVQPWEHLTPNLKDSNRQQADHIPVKLRAIGCFSSSVEHDEPAVKQFADKEIELLAQMEHSRWRAERLLDSWTQGPRDHERKTSLFLVDWQELPEDIKEYDQAAVRNIPHLLNLTGLKIYRRSRV